VRPLTLNVGPAVSAKRSPTRVRPRETGTHSRGASILAEYGFPQCPRAIISNGHVHHVSRDARVHHFACIYHIAHDGLYNHDDHNYPSKTFLSDNGYNQA
jgi:hypothetical protein